MTSEETQRIYAIVFAPEARQAMAGWPDEVREAVQRRLEQLADLPVDARGAHVRSVVRGGDADEFKLEIELQPEQSRLFVLRAG